MIQSPAFLAGSSDLLVLLALRRARLHCWGIAQRVQQLSSDVVQLDESTVNVSLRRMQNCGWVDVRPTPARAAAEVPVYCLTRQGRQQFKRLKADYERVAAAISRVMLQA